MKETAPFVAQHATRIPPQTHMENHRKTKHPGQRFHCPTCLKTYTSYYRLKIHHARVHEGLKHACSECAYKSNYRDQLQEHMNSAHRGVRYQCTECDLKYRHRGGLTTHIRFVHQGLGGYKCHQCGYRTLAKREFAAHIMSHAR